MVLAYAASRSRHYWSGSLFTVVYLNFMAYFFIAGFSPEVSPDFGYLVIALAILLTSVFFSSPQQATLISFTSFTGLILVEITILPGNFVTHFFRLAGVFLFVLLSAIYSTLVDRDRLEIISKSNEYLSEKRKVEMVMQAYPDGILALDTTGRIVAVNERAKVCYLKATGKELHAGEPCFDLPTNSFTEALVSLFKEHEDQVLSIEVKKRNVLATDFCRGAW
ncbi:MAG: hypothetical protein ACFFD4_04510 [Candidatus Odinarchaeota archaeon]